MLYSISTLLCVDDTFARCLETPLKTSEFFSKYTYVKFHLLFHTSLLRKGPDVSKHLADRIKQVGSSTVEWVYI
jgi:hypothetical protein